MFSPYQYIKSGIITFSLGLGLSGLNVYSNMYIYSRKIMKKMYYQNSSIKRITDFGLNIAHYLISSCAHYKIEPFHDYWVNIFYLTNGKQQDEYIDLSGVNAYVDFHLLDCLVAVPLWDLSNIQKIEKDLNQLFVDIYREINFNTTNTDFLIVFKVMNKYISRVSKKDYKPRERNIINNISLNTTAPLIICVEYFHPKMDKKIYLNIDKGYFIENNEILSPLFIERCLMYQKEPYIFDLDYKIHFLDYMIKQNTIDRTSYLLIMKNGYQIKSL